MAITTAEKNLVIVASALGILQGVPWLLMSLICIVVYNTGRLEVNIHESYLNFWNHQVYLKFLDKDFVEDPSYVVTPVTFTIFMWIYLFADLAWVIISIIQLTVLKNANNTTLNVITTWIVITINIILLDFIFAILIGIDFDKCLSDYNSLITTKVAQEAACTTVMIPVLVVICKGFVLLDINVIFAIILFKVFQSIKKRNVTDKSFLRTGTIPRATIQRTSNLYPQLILQNNPTSMYGHPPTSGQNAWSGNLNEGRNPLQNAGYLIQQQKYQNRY